MVPAAGVQFVISDKRNMAPCGVATSFQQDQFEVIVQPEGTPTTIEVVDEEDADIRMDLIDQMRDYERLP
eukprot:11669851-Karenia_brevis.AAC.1